MTRVEVLGQEIRLVYQKGQEVKEISLPNDFLPPSEKFSFAPGGLWAYEALGMGERYRKVVRLRRLRGLFGPKDYPSLEGYPYRVEVVREDKEGKVGLIQIGETIWLVSTFSPDLLKAPEKLAKRMMRNGHLVLSQGALRRLKGSSKEIWEELAKEGIESVFQALALPALVQERWRNGEGKGF